MGRQREAEVFFAVRMVRRMGAKRQEEERGGGGGEHQQQADFEGGEVLGFGEIHTGMIPGLVDQRPWQTVAALAPLAVSAEEKADALEAERLADHEVDQAFAMALRQADMQTRVLTGPALELQQKVNALSDTVKEDQTQVDALAAQGAAAKRGGAAADSAADNLDAAKAQQQLDSDELNDATDDLARESGDKRSQIQQELTAREAAMKKFDAQLGGGEIAVIAERRRGTLRERIDGWFSQRSRRDLLRQAKAETDADLAALVAQHAQIDTRSNAMTQKIKDEEAAAGAGGAVRGTGAGQADTDGAAQNKMARMAQVHGLAQIHSILDDRIATAQQLSAVYGRWIAQVGLQHRIVSHLMLQSLAWIAFLMLLGTLIWWATQELLDRAAARGTGMDPRSLHTLRTIASLAIQVVTLIAVLLAIFGAPNQVPTILGLGAAGLTVVFQDFILAFFGWFILMGKNGIREGDWVEINGVGGEVVEIGLFRTALLETGNWTDKGHPTGRRVTFINNFAVTGQYFNFSTAGQWMWDEISVNVPAGEAGQKTIEAIQQAVAAETEKDAKLAEAEWHSSSRSRGLSQFSATPSVDLRPAASGIDVLVRYVTRAGDRFEMRNKLYGAVIGLLHQGDGEATQAARPERVKA
jgi:small-conductance mechanosensitive channel